MVSLRSMLLLFTFKNTWNVALYLYTAIWNSRPIFLAVNAYKWRLVIWIWSLTFVSYNILQIPKISRKKELLYLTEKWGIFGGWEGDCHDFDLLFLNSKLCLKQRSVHDFFHLMPTVASPSFFKGGLRRRLEKKVNKWLCSEKQFALKIHPFREQNRRTAPFVNFRTDGQQNASKRHTMTTLYCCFFFS